MPSPVASFHLGRYPRARVLREMAATVTDGRSLRGTTGLRFAKRLGTGRGVAMGLGGDLRRWAAFCVWDDEDALDRFLERSTVARRWADGDESWSVRLDPLGGHGTWGGRAPLAGLAGRPAAGDDGPVAVLTRARLPVRHWPAFYRAVPPVEAQLHREAGVLAALGIGEAPVGLQATFSLWRSAAAVERFAYADGGAHAGVVGRARRLGWFREELFARFRPYASTGTWSGRDPLAGAGGNGS